MNPNLEQLAGLFGLCKVNLLVFEGVSGKDEEFCTEDVKEVLKAKEGQAVGSR